jgi:hypothetical protein
MAGTGEGNEEVEVAETGEEGGGICSGGPAAVELSCLSEPLTRKLPWASWLTPRARAGKLMGA